MKEVNNIKDVNNNSEKERGVMMKKRNSYYRYLILMGVIIMLICFSTPVWASIPEIYSITPDMGNNETSTYVTINGADFQPSPTVALYGGGPYITGACDTPGIAYGVHVEGNYAYVADRDSGFEVLDISDPVNPTIVGACDTPDLACGVHVEGSYAYVADGGSGLQVIDISDPVNPTIVGACNTPSSAYGVQVEGSYSYVADKHSGLYVIDRFSPLADISYIDSGSLTATVPAGYRPGTYNLHVTNPDGGHSVLNNAFTIVEIVDNVPPIANAGIDQTVAVDSNCIASIILDGSGSYDPDGDPLTYSWTWDGGSAIGISPTIQLPLGTKTITLLVNDGTVDSDPDDVEITVIDDSPPVVNILVPASDEAVQDGVTFTAEASDNCEIRSVYLTLREKGDIPIGYEKLEATFNTANSKWEYQFDTTQLADGYYVLTAKAEDASGNTDLSGPVMFSIRNWAVIELLPASQEYQAGRTMPIKFSLRIVEAVDPYQPFVYNEELLIKILDSEGTTLQESIYGDESTDYRINQLEELYITNFKTSRTPAEYEVEIWRIHNNFLLGNFDFITVNQKKPKDRLYIQGDYVSNYILGESGVIDNFNYGLGGFNGYGNFTTPAFTGLPTYYNNLGYGGLNFGGLNYGFDNFGKLGNFGFNNYPLSFSAINYSWPGSFDGIGISGFINYIAPSSYGLDFNDLNYGWPGIGIY